MNTKLQDQLTSYEAKTALARNFLNEYGDRLPEGLGSISISDTQACFSVLLNGQPTSEVERALAFLGDLFGTSDWTSKPDYSNRYFDWRKTLPSGMVLNIWGAATCPPLVEAPVPPQAFPLLLVSSGEAENTESAADSI